jgi:hypothetical protein
MKTMTCDEFFEILQREAPIDPTTQAALDVHASACDECVRVAEGLAAWREAEAHPERFPESPPWILESLHRRLDAMEREKGSRRAGSARAGSAGCSSRELPPSSSPSS